MGNCLVCGCCMQDVPRTVDENSEQQNSGHNDRTAEQQQGSEDTEQLLAPVYSEENVHDFLVTFYDKDVDHKKIDLSNAPIRDWKDLEEVLKVLQPKMLVSLTLKNSTITKIPFTIGLFSNVQTLNLSRNNIETIPWCIFYLVQLKLLDLSHNAIGELPRTIGYLKNLKILDVSHNQLTRLPTEILLLEKLKTLHLSCKQMVSPPGDVCSLGLSAILQGLQQRNQGRRNILRGLSTSAATHFTVDGEIKTLLQLSIEAVISYGVKFTDLAIPPVLECNLNKEIIKHNSSYTFSKCSGCGRFYSSVDKFETHWCPSR